MTDYVSLPAHAFDAADTPVGGTPAADSPVGGTPAADSPTADSPTADGWTRRGALRLAATTALAAPAAALLPAVLPPGRTAAAASADVAPSETIWASDFAGVGFGNWRDTPWNDQPQGEVARPRIATAPSGAAAARFHLDGGQQRNESEPATPQITEGQVLVVAFTDELLPGFPVDTPDWQVVLQFKNNGTGSPPCEVKINRGQYELDGNNGAWHHPIGPALTSGPTEIVLRIVFTADPSRATMDAWHNGRQTLAGALPEGAGTLYRQTGSYLKTGLYRNTAIDTPGTRMMTSLSVGRAR